jgi:hypothetical protein
MKKQTSYVATSLLSSCVLYFAWRLSSSGRGPVDWVVIGLAVLAVLWNLGNLGGRLHRSGGGRSVWHLQRTLLFWIIGIFNTVLVRPEDVGTWRHVVGWVLIVAAALDTYQLHRREQAGQAAGSEGGDRAE